MRGGRTGGRADRRTVLHGESGVAWSRSSPARSTPTRSPRSSWSWSWAKAGSFRRRGSTWTTLAGFARRARHPLHRRRDPDRLRPHRQALRLASTTAWCPTSSSRPSRWPAGSRSPRSPAAPTSWTPPHVGGLGGTYGGNPLACAAALAVLDAMEAERIPARAAAHWRPDQGAVLRSGRSSIRASATSGGWARWSAWSW